jgi:UDP-N-acetylmuramate--alanine ligase
MFRHIKHIHFVGIGGIGMSGIAELLINLGYEVSGSDLALSPTTQRIKELGAHVARGHRRENVRRADVVVYSSAIPQSNIEVREAHRRNIPCIPRVEILGELMRMKESIGIAGTHGKTTTTSMVGKILENAGFDPTIVVGGKLRSMGVNAKLGQGRFMVCEIDESDKLLLGLSPIINVITSIDEDHLDNYKDLDEIKETFLKFTDRVPFYGCNIVCDDDENIRSIIPRMKKRCVIYGFNEQSNLKIRHYELGNPSHFRVQSNGDTFGEFTLSLPGLHNILNACAAIAVGIELEIPMPVMKEAVSQFKGTDRRFELKGEAKGIRIMDDYAHHPREIEVTLKTARQLSQGRVVAIFQPHLYSRTKKLSHRFGDCFWDADQVFIMPIYRAREKRAKEVTGQLIVDAAISKGYKQMTYVESEEEIIEWCLQNLTSGDTVFTIGAGDVYKTGEKLLARLEGDSASRKTE